MLIPLFSPPTGRSLMTAARAGTAGGSAAVLGPRDPWSLLIDLTQVVLCLAVRHRVALSPAMPPTGASAAAGPAAAAAADAMPHLPMPLPAVQYSQLWWTARAAAHRLVLSGCTSQEGRHFAVYLFVHRKHSPKAGPFSVARLKIDLPFNNRLAFTGEVPAVFPLRPQISMWPGCFVRS